MRFANAEVNGGTAIEALERVVKKRWRRTSGKDWGNLYQDLCESIGEILLMVQKSGDHQLRLVVYPRYLHGFIHPRWCRNSSINSMVAVREGWWNCSLPFVIFLWLFFPRRSIVVRHGWRAEGACCPAKFTYSNPSKKLVFLLMRIWPRPLHSLM